MATAVSAEQGSSSRLSAYYELTKPNLTGLVVVTTLLGVALAGGAPLSVLLATIIGTALSGGGACALNMYMESELDVAMRRTAARPLPSRRVSEVEAVAVGVSLVGLGGTLLWAFTNPLTALLSLLATAVYIFLYTPLKRVSWWATVAGAIPGALPPMMGYTAVKGALSVEAWIVFGILFFWQLPHFWALAIMFREDYARGGFKLWPGEGMRPVVWRILLTTVLLLVTSASLFVVGASGYVFLIGSAVLGGWFFSRAIALARSQTLVDARRLFLGSIVYLPLLLVLLVADKPALIAQLFSFRF